MADDPWCEGRRPNALWTGDALHGPNLAGRKAYLLAFIDDFRRALVGHRWTAAEDTIRLEGALRAGLACRGCPRPSWSTGGGVRVGALARASAAHIAVVGHITATDLAHHTGAVEGPTGS